MALGHTHAVVGLCLLVWLLQVLVGVCIEESCVCTKVPKADSSEGTKGSMLADCWKLVAVVGVGVVLYLCPYGSHWLCRAGSLVVVAPPVGGYSGVGLGGVGVLLESAIKGLVVIPLVS